MCVCDVFKCCVCGSFIDARSYYIVCVPDINDSPKEKSYSLSSVSIFKH